ncbi:MAG: hypothetical protein U0K68_05915 [Agathobacter sp.]|nr:hypothetical protein [Agathobacter sp.]
MIEKSKKNITMSYREWVEYATLNYEVVSKLYQKRVYEAMVIDPETGEPNLVQLTLADVLNKCEGTSLESAVRNAVMKSVYTNEKLEKGIRQVMDDYYEV